MLSIIMMKLVSYNSAYIYLAYDIKYISWKLDVKICCQYNTVGILHNVEKMVLLKSGISSPRFIAICSTFILTLNAGDITIWTRFENTHYENNGHLLYFTLM